MKPHIISCLVAFIISFSIKAQASAKELKIGDKIPSIVINNLIHSKSSSINLSDLKGKLIILDFWATYCVPCVRALPEMDSLQKEFPNDIEVIAVTNENKETVERFFKNIPSIRDVSLPCVVSDTILGKFFPHNSVPHEVIIDKNGIVKAITFVSGLTSTNIQALLRGKIPEFAEKKTAKNIDLQKPLFVEDNGEKLLYHFLITDYFEGLLSIIGKYPGNYPEPDTRLYGTNVSLLNVYRTALLHRLASPEYFPDNRIRIHVKDNAAFVIPGNPMERDEWAKKYSFCFDLVVPPSMSGNLYDRLKEELDNYFNLSSSIESTSTKCLLLKSLDSSKFKSTSPQMIADWGKNLWTLKKYPMSSFVEKINTMSEHPIVDETGYGGRIDITLIPSFSNIQQLKAQLNKNGLDLVEGEREMDVITISDK